MSIAVIMVVSLVAAIDLAIPEPAAGGLDPSPAELLWIVDSYVVVFACLLIPAGAMGDRFGRGLLRALLPVLRQRPVSAGDEGLQPVGP